MNAGTAHENIIYDAWLSEILGRKACKVVVDNLFIENDGRRIIEDLQSEKVFLYSKVPVISSNSKIRLFMEESGFRMIDMNVVYEKPVSQGREFTGNMTVRFAKADDEEQVAGLAGRSFRFSRFHCDKNFPAGTADKIKAEWARNFFRRKRGEYMVIADSGNGIKGFLQLIREGTFTFVIDLIAVDEFSRHKGVASDMITFAEKNCVGAKYLRVGTQKINVPSKMMYEKLGFAELASCEEYVFHYHSPEMRKV